MRTIWSRIVARNLVAECARYDDGIPECKAVELCGNGSEYTSSEHGCFSGAALTRYTGGVACCVTQNVGDLQELSFDDVVKAYETWNV